MTFRTRFAPSPTGYLHVGGVRTALFDWLLARKYKGIFILRVEDTDLERSTPEAVQAIIDGMKWLGLDYDEGPYYQTKRFDRYHAVTKQLIAEGKAYRCYCSKERLEKLRANQLATKQKPRYDGHCRDLKNNDLTQPHVIRFLNPQQGEVAFDDAVHGRTIFQNSELDDLIIVRTDGSPTYNFTVVVDDYDMKITHVIRGDDHLNNTPRQINILQALGATLPQYAHLPMILGDDGKKLSKRHGAVSVLQFQEDGYLPQALLNYLVRLGWSHGDQEVFSLNEMIELFDINAVNKAAAAFNTSKLIWLNQYYLKNSDPKDVARELTWHMQKLNINYQQGPALEEIILIQRERSKTLVEMAKKSRFFYEDVNLTEELKKQTISTDMIPMLQLLHNSLLALTEWTDDAIHKVLNDLATAQQISLGKLAQPVRVILTGGTVSPPLNNTMRVLGKELTLQRLAKVIP
jgi:glutamyl-tRNA synthetase